VSFVFGPAGAKIESKKMAILKKITLLFGDIVILYLSLAIALYVRYQTVFADEAFRAHLFPFSMIFVIWIFVFYLSDLYHDRVFRSTSSLFTAVGGAVAVATIVSIMAFYLFSGLFELTPKTNLLIFAIIFFLLSFGWRLVVLKIFVSGALGIAIIGNSNLVAETVEYLNKNPHRGYRVVSWAKNPSNINLEEITRLVEEKKIQLMVMVQPYITKELTTKMVRELLPHEVGFVNFWDFYETIFEKVPLEELGENWFMENITTRRPAYDAMKRFVDVILAIAVGLILLPLALLIAIIIKLTSAGEVVYKDRRAGQHGSIFTIYKFRSMKRNNTGPLWTEKNDPRVTGIGKFIRFTHLDEIPQLVNIIQGNISFTGPRPENAGLAEQYKKFPYYEIRQIIKPGLTGWAQINYKPSASFDEAYEKLRYDIYYVKNRSFLLDLRITLKTIKYVFFSH
jgi:exopolysaccharide biosynthesis polyprenyl glycosylphosphotransferase